MSDASFAFGALQWNPIVCILPAADLEKMDGSGSETRHPLITWKSCVVSEDGSKAEETMQMKASSISFDRFGDTVKYRFEVKGFEQTTKDDVKQCQPKDFSTSNVLTMQELRLTTRVKWETKSFKWKSDSSGLATRTVAMTFMFEKEELKHSDIIQIEIFAPKTSDIDKGKTLKTAVEWGKLVVDANMKYQQLIREM
ncbi:hypothetical protein SEMRO_1417_G270910.1 [Seminavis robusta]|uniref:Uncharacterized protein n=1 Tax=Seminavis robusta TaxID=568900 RepID=A0A9N8ELJ4_9STRA|nr:hypothetical protein SEMRO_1417_G270910.1 [Seminavis robusta]|eukprot:Sro1417_g270910.1 n/a (197) ;mRNA; r:13350-13940